MATSVEKLQQLHADLPELLAHLDPGLRPMAALGLPLLAPSLQRFCSQGPAKVDQALERLAEAIVSLRSDPPDIAEWAAAEPVTDPAWFGAHGEG